MSKYTLDWCKIFTVARQAPRVFQHTRKGSWVYVAHVSASFASINLESEFIEVVW